MASTLDQKQWRPRRNLSLLVRGLAFAIPLVGAAAAVRGAQIVLPRPHGDLAFTGWLVALVLLAIVTFRLVAHASRRLLPLGALLRLPLVFPDRAPSRVRVACRAGSDRALQRAIEDATPVDGYPAAQPAAEVLVALVVSVASGSRPDRRTRGHGERVRAYADLIGEQLGLDDDARARLQWAALLHDLGELEVPPAVLRKRARPTAQEREVRRGHPGASGAYIAPIAGWLGEWARAATEHHERVDGGGYPLGLRGDEISLAGRIVAVADAFDVMTSGRSFRNPRPAARARAELVGHAGTQFDADVVRAFVRVSQRDVGAGSGPLGFPVRFPALAPAVAGVAAVALAFTAPGGTEPPSAAPAALALGGRGSGGPVAVSGTTPRAPRPVTIVTTARRPAVTSLTTGTGSSKAGTSASRPAHGHAAAPAPGSPTSTPPTNPPGPPTTRPRSPTTTTPAPVNHPPVVRDDAPKGMQHTQTVMIDVLANDTDPDGNLAPSTLRVVTYPPAGTYQSIAVVGNEIRFTAPAGFKGTVSFRYQVCDTMGACGQAEVTLGFVLH